MNRHFQDTKYYLKRAAVTAKAGIAAEFAPVTRRLRARFDSEEEEEAATRTAAVRNRVAETGARVRTSVEESVSKARGEIEKRREKPTR